MEEILRTMFAVVRVVFPDKSLDTGAGPGSSVCVSEELLKKLT